MRLEPARLCFKRPNERALEARHTIRALAPRTLRAARASGGCTQWWADRRSRAG